MFTSLLNLFIDIGDLTNAQLPMLNPYPIRIEHWELNIGQIRRVPATDE
jgi:hypothetical protein